MLHLRSFASVAPSTAASHLVSLGPGWLRTTRLRHRRPPWRLGALLSLDISLLLGLSALLLCFCLTPVTMSAALSSEGFCESSALLPSSPVNRPAQERTAPCPPSTSRSDHEHLLATSPASYGTMETHELRRTGSASVLAAHPTRRSSVAESPLADLLDPATSTNGFPEQQIRMRGAASATDQKNDTLDTPSAPGPPPQPTAQQKTQGSKNRKRWGGLVWELENKGAVARDHLAGERTFLAWLRTSLALASIGIGASFSQATPL